MSAQHAEYEEPKAIMTVDPRLVVGPAPAPANDPFPVPQYAQGFDGMAIQPFDERTRAILSRAVDVDDVEIKPDGICYLPGIFYRRILTDAFGQGGWAIAMRGPVKTRNGGGGELVVFHGALYCLGRFVAEAFGECTYYPSNRGMTYADAVEGAKTNCIDRCCKDLGVASELWDPTWRGQWQSKYASKTGRDKDGKPVWERKSRANKLTDASATSATTATAAAAPTKSATPPAITAPSAPVATSTGSSKTTIADDGEAIDDNEVAGLTSLIRNLGWKLQFTRDWFLARMGFKMKTAADLAGLTRRQFQTAEELLCAWQESRERYNTCLVLAIKDGRAQGDFVACCWRR